PSAKGFRNKEVTRYVSHRFQNLQIFNAVVFAQTSDHSVPWDGVFLQGGRLMSICGLQGKKSTLGIEICTLYFVLSVLFFVEDNISARGSKYKEQSTTISPCAAVPSHSGNSRFQSPSVHRDPSCHTSAE